MDGETKFLPLESFRGRALPAQKRPGSTFCLSPGVTDVTDVTDISLSAVGEAV